MKQSCRVLSILFGVCLLATNWVPAANYDFAKRSVERSESVSSPDAPDDLPPAPVGAVIAFLQLTEAQAGLLVGLIQQREQVVIPLAQEIAQLEQTLDQALSSPNPEPPLIGGLVLQIRARRAMIHAAQADFLVFFDNHLDQNQREKLHAARTAKALQPVLPALGAVGLL